MKMTDGKLSITKAGGVPLLCGVSSLLLLFTASTCLGATNRDLVIDSNGPVDFLYSDGQTEAPVPFPGVQECALAYMDTASGLVIERVVREGKDVQSAPTKLMRTRFRYIVKNPGPGFQYELPLYALSSVDPNHNFEGKSFPMYGRPVPKVIDIYYRIRCANDEVGALKVTHGVLLKYKEPPSTGSENSGNGVPSPGSDVKHQEKKQ
jgi:hypothetical protein